MTPTTTGGKKRPLHVQRGAQVVREIEAVLKRYQAGFVCEQPVHIWVDGKEAGTIDHICGGDTDLTFVPATKWCPTNGWSIP